MVSSGFKYGLLVLPTCCVNDVCVWLLGCHWHWAFAYSDMFLSIFDSLQIYVCRWWMGHYHSKTPKRHICWANTPKIGRLDKGVLKKQQREEIAKMGVRSVKTKVNKKGGKSYSGTSALRGTGFGSQLFLLPYLFTWIYLNPAMGSCAVSGSAATKEHHDNWGQIEVTNFCMC